MNEEICPFQVTTFLSDGRERCATTSGVIDTACARTVAGTCWFEKFEMEMEKHATPVELVPTMRRSDSDLVPSREVLGQLFSILLWDKRIPLEGKPPRRRGSLVTQYGSGEALGRCD